MVVDALLGDEKCVVRRLSVRYRVEVCTVKGNNDDSSVGRRIQRQRLDSGEECSGRWIRTYTCDMMILSAFSSATSVLWSLTNMHNVVKHWQQESSHHLDNTSRRSQLDIAFPLALLFGDILLIHIF